MSKYGVFSGPYFPVLGLNTEIYGVKNSIFGHFSRCENVIIRNGALYIYQTLLNIFQPRRFLMLIAENKYFLLAYILNENLNATDYSEIT